jgi:uncharacterized RDD family membrane protein YckC
MSWYYYKDDEKIGPITKEQVDILIQNNVITAETRIWNDSTQTWKTYQEVATDITMDEPSTLEIAPEESTTDTSPSSQAIPCDICGLPFPQNEMTDIGDKQYCETCKKEYFKEIKSNLSIGRALPYASFFNRLIAKAIDYVVIIIIYTVLSFLFSLIGVSGLFVYFIALLVSTAYSIYFVGTYNATIGKMIIGIEIIVPDGTAVDYKVATYRLLAEGLSSFGLYFGYFLIFFDAEKRTLHDRICNTRVVFR